MKWLKPITVSEKTYKIFYWAMFAFMCVCIYLAGHYRGAYDTAVITHQKCNDYIVKNFYHGYYDSGSGLFLPYHNEGFYNLSGIYTIYTNLSWRENKSG